MFYHKKGSKTTGSSDAIYIEDIRPIIHKDACTLEAVMPAIVLRTSMDCKVNLQKSILVSMQI